MGDGRVVDCGSVYVYRWNGSSWVETKLWASDAAGSDFFGQSVAVSADGSKVVTGAYGHDSSKGSAYVYQWNGSSYDQSRKLVLSNGLTNDYFGWCVAVSADGGTVAVGANIGYHEHFSVWVYAE
jgi:hypothetical protein